MEAVNLKNGNRAAHCAGHDEVVELKSQK